MSWRDFFKSNLVRQLEAEVAYLRGQLDKQENTHAERLKDAINQNQKLRDELERTRILLSPGLANIELPHEQVKETPAPAEYIPTGNSWQSVLARETRAEQIRGRAAAQAQATATAKGVTDGSDGSGRQEIPQRVESKAS